MSKSLFKVALVKSIYSPYYKNTKAKSLTETINSSLGPHFAFGALLKYYDTKIFTIDDHSINKKITIEPFLLSGGVNFKKSKYSGRDNKSVFFSNDIDWSTFDLIIALEACVPKKTVKKYPQVLWATMITIPSYSFYIFNRVIPFFGYQISLFDKMTHNYLNDEEIQRYSFQKKLIVDFPLAFMKSGDLYKLNKVKSKSGIHLEPQCSKEIRSEQLNKLKQFGPVTYRVPLSEYYETLSSKKYFIALAQDVRFIRGNALVESNSANCLILCQTAIRLTHSKMLTTEMLFSDFEELLGKLKQYESKPTLYNKHLQQQQKHIDQYFFDNPKNLLDELINLHKKKWHIKEPLKIRFLDAFFTTTYPLVWRFIMPSYLFFFYIFKIIFKKDLTATLSRILNKGK